MTSEDNDNNRQPSGFYVYIHVRRTDGKVFYVGKGSGRRAWSSSGRNRHWIAVRNRHGFYAYIIKDGLAEHEAYQGESELIQFFGLEKLATYTSGGPGISGYRHTDAAKKSMAEKRRGKEMSQDARMRMSEAIRSSPHLLQIRSDNFTGENNPAKSLANRMESSERMRQRNPMRDHKAREKMAAKRRGVALSEEHRRKVGDALRGKRRGPMPDNVRQILADVQEKRKKPVETECGLKFDSSLQASKSTGISQGSISNNCVGRTKSAGGMKWRFIDERS